MGANAVMILTLIIGIVIFWRISAKRFHDDIAKLAAGLTLLGGLVTLISFLALVWSKPGDPNAFARNLKWARDRQTMIVSMLKQTSEMDISSGVDSISLHALLENDETEGFLRHSERGDPFYAWQIGRLCWSYAPELSIGLMAGVLSGLLGVLIATREMIAGEIRWRILAVGNTVIAAAGFLMIISKITFLDTLGTISNIQIRLIATLAEMEITLAPWWMAFGLFLLILSGIVHIFSDESSDQGDPYLKKGRHSYYE